MEGKISKEGKLFIKRAGELKAQECMHSRPRCACSDLCPFFSEPSQPWLDSDLSFSEETVLWLCDKKDLCFTKFTDER